MQKAWTKARHSKLPVHKGKVKSYFVFTFSFIPLCVFLFKRKFLAWFHGYSASVPQQSTDMLHEDSFREASEENYDDEDESDQSSDNWQR